MAERVPEHTASAHDAIAAIAVVPTDATGTEWALEWAIRRARRDARALVLAVAGGQEHRRVGATRRRLRELAPWLRVGVVPLATTADRGADRPRPGAGVLVLGAATPAGRPPRMPRALTRVLAQAQPLPCPVLLLRRPPHGTGEVLHPPGPLSGGVLVVLERAADTEVLVGHALAAARERGTGVTVLHACWERPDRPGPTRAPGAPGGRVRARHDLLSERVDRAARRQPGVPHRVVVTAGLVERALDRETTHELVVVAHRPRSAGRPDARLLLGAVTRQTGGDLLVVPRD